MNWYYSLNGQSIGPVSEEEMKQLITSKKINSLTYIWSSDIKEWIRVGQSNFSSLIESVPPPAPDATAQKIDNVVQKIKPTTGNFVNNNFGGYTAQTNNNMQFLISPPDNQKIRSVTPKEIRYPAIITDAKAFCKNAQINMSSDFVYRMI